MSQYISLEHQGNSMPTAVKQTCCPYCTPGFSGDDWMVAWVYSLPPLAAPLSSELPAYTHSFTTTMWVQAHVGWPRSKQGSQSPPVSFLFFFIPPCALHHASVSMRAPWEFTAMASDKINQALQIQALLKKSFGPSFKAEKGHNLKFRSNLPM